MVWNLLFLGVVLPAIFSGAILFFPYMVWRKKSLIIAPYAVSIGYAAGYTGIAGFPSFPPLEASGWTVYLSLLAAVISTVNGYALKKKYDYFIMVLLSFGISFLLLRPLLEFAWSTHEGILWITIAGIFILLIWYLVNNSSEVSGSLPALSAALVLCAFSGIVLLLSGSISMGQLSGALAASLVPAALLSLLAPDVSIYRNVIPVIVSIIVGLWVIGYFYAEMSLLSILFLFIASCAPFICKIAWVGGLSPLKRAFLIGTAAALPSAAALAVAAFYYF